MAESRKPEKPTLGRTWYRPLWLFWGSLLVRTAHLLAVALFLGSVVFGHQRASLWLVWAAMGSGLLLIVTEGVRHREMYREFFGVVTMVKCLLLGAAMHQLLPQLPVFFVVFVVAALAAHAPKQLRHRLLW